MATAKTKTRKKGSIKIDSAFCKGCEMCIYFCPKDCIVLSNNINAAGYMTAAPVKKSDDSGACTGCATCALVCPEAAIEVYRG
jgi:2-oxoglutarate ferredoxin oxidoreductase subunit delta